jgi:HEAT repeat protein
MKTIHDAYAMRTRPKWLIGFVVITAIFITLVFLNLEREPFHKGKSLSRWLEILNSGEESENALIAISQIGTNAIPFLLTWMEQKPSRLTEELLQLRDPEFGRWKWIPAWATGYRKQKRNDIAPLGFLPLGEKAAPAIPKLTAMARSSERWMSERATWALQMIGVPAIPAIVALLADTNAPSDARNRAMFALSELAYAAKMNGTLGDKANIAVSPLLENLEGFDEHIASRAADTLGILTLQSEICVPSLVNALQDSRVSVRDSAAFALKSYGVQAATAVPALLHAVKEDHAIRKSAIQALTAIEPSALKSVRDTLVDALIDPDNSVRLAATNALLFVAPEILTNAPAQ